MTGERHNTMAHYMARTLLGMKIQYGNQTYTIEYVEVDKTETSEGIADTFNFSLRKEGDTYLDPYTEVTLALCQIVRDDYGMLHVQW